MFASWGLGPYLGIWTLRFEDLDPQRDGQNAQYLRLLVTKSHQKYPIGNRNHKTLGVWGPVDDVDQGIHLFSYTVVASVAPNSSPFVNSGFDPQYSPEMAVSIYEGPQFGSHHGIFGSVFQAPDFLETAEWVLELTETTQSLESLRRTFWTYERGTHMN